MKTPTVSDVLDAVQELRVDLTSKYDHLTDNMTRLTDNVAHVMEVQKQHSVALLELQTDVGSLKADVGSLKADVGSLKLDVGSLKADVGSLKTIVRGHSSALARIERRQIAETRSLDDHERRISALEAGSA